MLTGLDHLVILVRDLEEAIPGYERLGFRVTPGGEHADGLTRNALVPFADGTYFELVAFIHPDDERDNVWGWREFLPGEGLIDYCAASNGMTDEVRRLEDLGLGVNGPDDGGRTLPNGQEIEWRSASIRQEGRLMPFLIEDVTPRGTRVPAGRAANHPNGATGIRRLEVSVPDPNRAREVLSALTENQPHKLALGGCALTVVEGERPGPVAVGLATDDVANAGELDPEFAHGVSIQLSGNG